MSTARLLYLRFKAIRLNSKSKTVKSLRGRRLRSRIVATRGIVQTNDTYVTIVWDVGYAGNKWPTSGNNGTGCEHSLVLVRDFAARALSAHVGTQSVILCHINCVSCSG